MFIILSRKNVQVLNFQSKLLKHNLKENKTNKILMKRSKYLIFLILLFLISNGCSQPLESNSNSKLLYISGKYLSFGAFGDVKIITETSLEEGSITSDRVYDYSPFLMDSNTVLFLTKRDKSDKGLGLGKSNQLYTYNLNTKKLHDLKINKYDFCQFC